MGGFDNSISNLTGISRGRFGKLHILRAGTFQDINSVVDGIASSVDLSDYYTQAEVDAEIQVETDARNLLATNTATALASKQATLTAGANITITGSTISATNLEVAVDGVLQTLTRIDFLAPTNSLNNGVLTLGPSDFQSRLSLIYASSADSLDLTRSQSGNLLWDGNEVASKASVDDERTARQTFQSDTNTVLNTKQTVDDPQTKVRLGTSTDNKDLTKSATGTLVWGSNDIVEAPTLNALETYTIAQLALKQDVLTAGTNITISNNTISATGGSTLEVAVNGTTQAATKLDFLANEAVLSSGTLLIGPPLTTRVGLWFANAADHKDLTQGAGGILKWGTETVQMEAVRPCAQFARAAGQYFGSGFTTIAWTNAPVSSGITLSTSNGTFSVSRSGIYSITTAFRTGSGPDEWHGVSLVNSSGAQLAKSFATGQDTPVSGEGQTFPLLVSLSTGQSYSIKLYRQTSLTVATPGIPGAGWAIVATITYAS